MRASRLVCLLFTLMMTTLISLFFPYNNTLEIVLSVIGVLIFSAYILYDTHMITKRLSPEEWVIAACELYLDFINLFLFILRIFGAARR